MSEPSILTFVVRRQLVATKAEAKVGLQSTHYGRIIKCESGRG